MTSSVSSSRPIAMRSVVGSPSRSNNDDASVTASRMSSIWSIGMSRRAATPATTFRSTWTNAGVAGTSTETVVGKFVTMSTYTTGASSAPDLRRIAPWI